MCVVFAARILHMKITKAEILSILAIALPLVAAFLAQRGMEFIDTLMLGWIDSTALAAGAISSAFFGTLQIFCMGALSVIGIFVARQRGSGNVNEIKLTLHQGLCWASLLAVPCVLIIWFTPQLLLKIYQNPQVIADATLILHGMVWGFPGFLLFLILKELISAFLLTRVVMIVSLISIPLTYVVNYTLIYGKYHFPRLGIAGIGYGSSIVIWLMFLSLFFYSNQHVLLKKHIILKPIKFNYVQFKELVTIGMTGGILFLLEAGMFLITAVIMGYFGTAALAAHQIALQCVNIAYTIPLAISTATAFQVGHAAGSKNIEQAQRIALISFSIVVALSAIIAAIFMFTTHSLVSIFLEKSARDYETVYQLANSLLHIAALFLCFDALQSVANGALRGLKDTFIPMFLCIGCYWVLGVGGAYYFSMHTALGAKGVWLGLTLGLSSTAIILILRFFKRSQALNSIDTYCLQD